MSATDRLDLTHRPPVAERVSHVTRHHGKQIADPYHWMRDDTRKDEAVLAHLKAENAYTDAVMAPLRPRVEMLFDEMVARIKEDDDTPPARWGSFLYYSRTEKGKQYRIFCRREDERGTEQVYLDVNREAEGHDYYRLGAVCISPDHRLVAWAADTDGGETYTIRVRDLISGEDLPDTIHGAYAGVEWASDNRTLFYTTLDKTHRPYRLHRHELGAATEDPVVFEEPDESFFLGIHRTRSGRYLILHLGSNDTNEVHYLAADDPTGDFRLFEPRRKGVEYAVDHWGDRFLVHTNEEAVNFRLLEAPLSAPRRANWREVLPHRPEVQLEEVEPFRDHIVVVERCEGVGRLRVLAMPGYEPHEVRFDEPAYTVTPTVNPEYDTGTVRFVYQSLCTPETTIDYDMQARARAVLKVEEVLGGYDPGEYVTERVTAIATDGERVPISLVHRRGLELDGDNPLLLYGYGSYGSTHTDPSFQSLRLSLIDRGFVFAIAHVRGGGDLGRPWYDAGKLEHKTNTFTDFIACAEHLIDAGYTSPGRLAIRGGSAGGLLVGAVVNMRPELFRAAVAKVPFVDVINTMLDPTLPLTVIEYDEWGNPSEPDVFERLLAYSPYENIEAQAYPNLFVTGALTDPRVAYWEPAKWVARIREHHTGDGVFLLKTDLGAGHGGPSGRYDWIREMALEYAFLIERCGASF
ncbi:MAG: prolyl oligopeptidase family serine peptidase [Acidobacteria bacterium]|nr:prolyl oligopeptidase family serine peptidase [Acidobacteriota bacterium]NIM61870.1 prolyl oligopeptidase family serine peptidase [Acidobacteriota bacterium]NIO60827.1 prolyl oligopeptidase family serine peptidase [Acidobacteriota bacterium]NIQ31902.1 prolyl oligopeptidase family serine peptidase [Acidobacteriota bacterium]NIQ87279.1 prolyl oligopeptidase family serine peptidase [Acidobacteriota bacterium]